MRIARVLKYMMQLNTVARVIEKTSPGKLFTNMNRMDVQLVAAQIEHSDRAAWTKRDYGLLLL
ncbi:hypothetical protein [Methanosarcina horonobensis]|uniref:hypothetical protein n=2 Tax=Methanosarcina horonobensis TaxID=418008 RepID=UPI001300E4ED|nr:hypothetical protein [Methanosarcina horonobensis]